MKKSLLLFIVLLVTYNIKSQWNSIDLKIENDLKSIFFIDLSTGFIVGSDGLILKTTDGGINWSKKVSGTSETLNSISFLDSKFGIAIGNNGIIVQSSDSGENWLLVNSKTENALLSVDFNDSGSAFIIGHNSKFLNSNDTGLTWDSKVGPLGEIPYPRCIQMINDTGYAIGNYTSFYETTDGGKNWKGKTITNFTEPPYKHLNCLFFLTSRIAYAAGINYYDGINDKALIYKTINGGESWEDVTDLSFKPINSLFITKEIGIAVGTEGTIIRTNDEGKNWKKDEISIFDNLNCISFKDSATAFIVGDNGRLLMTSKDVTKVTTSKQSNLLDLYPNPVESILKIRTSEQGSLGIYDTNGQLILFKKIALPEEVLNVSNLSKGFYLLKYKSDNSFHTIKLIKK